MGDVLNRGTKDKPLWYCRYVDIDGRRKQRASGADNRGDARRFLDDIEQRVKAGLPGCPRASAVPREEMKAELRAELDQKARRSSITVEELSKRFLGDVEGDPGYAPPRIKSLKSYRGDARSALNRHILPRLGRKAAAEVKGTDIEKMRDAIARTKKPATVIHTLAVLSKLFAWSKRVGLVDCANPVQGVERPRADASVDFLDVQETKKLLAKAEELAELEQATHEHRVRFPMVAIAVYCGLRRGELLGLRWRDVDLDAGRITVARSYRLSPKSGHVRHVPAHPELVTLLRAWQKLCPDVEGLVLPIEASPGKLRMGVERDGVALVELLELAGCHKPADGKSWHMLRHTFASNFMMAGGSLFALQRLLGHASPNMTVRYSHLAPDFMKADVARMSFAKPAPAGVSQMDEARRRKLADQAGA